MIYATGATSVSVDVFFADDAGAALTGKVAADFPACKWSAGNNTADTTITLSDLAAITTAHPNDNTAGGIKEREGGWYRLDLPNNVFTAAGMKRLTFAETTNKRILSPAIEVGAKVDVDTIKTGTIAHGGGTVTFPGSATIASTTNITAATGIVLSGVTHTGAVIPTVSAVTGLTASDVGEIKTKTDFLPSATAGAAGGVFIAGSNAATTVATWTSTGASTNGSTVLGNVTAGTITQTGAVSLGATTIASAAITGALSVGTTTTFTGNVSLAAGMTVTQSASNTPGIQVTGNGTGAGLKVTGGAIGHGLSAIGGATSGDGIHSTATTSGKGINAIGVGTTMPGILATGGTTTSAGIEAVGGATSGDGVIMRAVTSGKGLVARGIGTSMAGMYVTGGTISSSGIYAAGGGTGHGLDVNGGSSGDGIYARGGSTYGDGISAIGAGSGHGISATAYGSNRHGIIVTGGDSGTSDGFKAVAGTGGVGVRTDTITTSGTVTFNALTVSAGTTLTGAVTATHASNDVRGITVSTNSDKSGYSLTAGTGLGNQTADITGSLSGSVGSVTGNVGGNVVGSVGSVVAAVATTSNIKKNQALAAFQFTMLDDTTKLPVPGKTVTVTRNIDNADSFVAGTLSAVSEVGNGVYRVDFGAGDLNGNVIVLRATAADCDDTLERIVTQP